VRLLIDTCTFLGAAAGAEELSATARGLFANLENEVYLSPVSSWEMAVKCSLGRLALPRPPHEFVPEQRRRHGIAPLPLEETAVLQLARLPDYHRDPFDRVLVCQAIAHGLAILTPDEAVGRSPVPTIW
jgi:PIN domain nuclease of toxin-antitoxin system